MNFKILSILVILCASGFVHALDEVVVTPSRNVQLINEVVPSVIVIDRKTIERSYATDIADLLRWHAGLDIARTGGFGQQSSVFIRGTNSNHTAVLINGVKMNSATTGAAALEMINPAVVERIEIIKGPRSTVYGSEAIGGVINIITSNEKPINRVAIHLSNGRYSTEEQGVDVEYGNNNISSNFSFNRIDTDGFPATTTSNTRHGHDNDTFDFNLSTTFGLTELEIGYWQTQGNTEYDGFGVDLDQDRKNNVFNVGMNFIFSENWKSIFSISKTKDEIRQNQFNFLGDEDFAHTDRVIYDWKNDITLNDNHLTLGISKTDEDTKSLSFGTSYKEKTDLHAIYLHDQLIKDKHSLFTSTRYTDHEDFDETITWNLEYAYAVSDRAKLLASIGTGFRAPDSNARFGFGGNPNLREETSHTIELGVNYEFNQNTKASLRAYENKIEDLIETILIDPGAFIFENRNVNNARIRGLEFSFRHAAKQWDIDIAGVMQNPRNETDDSPLLRRAKRSLNGSMRYNHERYYFVLNGLLTSERRDFGNEALPGYGLVSIVAGVTFPNATLSIKAENLFDKDYELASGFNTPGQSIFAELRIKFTE